ncbi:hypothetical protein OG535_22730 [Kitasatospora sp. NBC_00085]
MTDWRMVSIVTLSAVTKAAKSRAGLIAISAPTASAGPPIVAAD